MRQNRVGGKAAGERRADVAAGAVGGKAQGEVLEAAVAAAHVVEDRRSVLEVGPAPGPIAEIPGPKRRRRGWCRNRRRRARTGSGRRGSPPRGRRAPSATSGAGPPRRGWKGVPREACWGAGGSVPRTREGIGARHLVEGEGEGGAVPGETARTDPDLRRVPAQGIPAALGHAEAVGALPVEHDVQGAVVERVAAEVQGVIGREHAADEGDDREPLAPSSLRASTYHQT